jgi:hypothetical protein
MRLREAVPGRRRVRRQEGATARLARFVRALNSLPFEREGARAGCAGLWKGSLSGPMHRALRRRRETGQQSNTAKQDQTGRAVLAHAPTVPKIQRARKRR